MMWNHTQAFVDVLDNIIMFYMNNFILFKIYSLWMKHFAIYKVKDFHK